MGNAASCAPSVLTNGAVKVLFLDGRLQVYTRPFKAAELMLEYPGQFVCESSNLKVGYRIEGLSADEVLERGKDTRSGFTKNLYDALIEQGIKAFMDGEDMRKGEEIGDVLVKAIEGSKLAIIVFSENYADSSWCLDELVRIIDCKNRKGQTVIPVFYKVEPTDVRKQQKSFGEAMASHESNFIYDMEKVRRWRTALFKAANISGCSTLDHRFEKDLIEEIVKNVLEILFPDGSHKSQVTAPADGVNVNGVKTYAETQVSDVYRNRSDRATENGAKMKVDKGKAKAGHSNGKFEEALSPLQDGQVIVIHSSGDLDKKLSAASKTSRLAILYFTATRCGSCGSISPLFTSLAEQYPKVVFLKVDTDEAAEAAARWNISTIPSFCFIKNGKEVDKLDGAYTGTLERKIARHAEC